MLRYTLSRLLAINAVFSASTRITTCNGQTCTQYVDSGGQDSAECLDYCGAGTIFSFTYVEVSGVGAGFTCAILCAPGGQIDSGDCTNDFISGGTSPEIICPKYCGINPTSPTSAPQYYINCVEGDVTTECLFNTPSPVQLETRNFGTITFGTESYLSVQCTNGVALSISTCSCFIFVNPGSLLDNSDTCNQCTLGEISSTSINIASWDCSNKIVGNCAVFDPVVGCLSSNSMPVATPQPLPVSRPTFPPQPSRPNTTPFFPLASPTNFPQPDPTPFPIVDPTNFPQPDPTPFPIVQPTNFPQPDPTIFPIASPTNVPQPDSTSFPSIKPTNVPQKDTATTSPSSINVVQSDPTPQQKPIPSPTIAGSENLQQQRDTSGVTKERNIVAIFFIIEMFFVHVVINFLD